MTQAGNHHHHRRSEERQPTLFSYSVSSSIRTVLRSPSYCSRISRRASSRRDSYSISRPESTSSIVFVVRLLTSCISCFAHASSNKSTRINCVIINNVKRTEGTKGSKGDERKQGGRKEARGTKGSNGDERKQWGRKEARGTKGSKGDERKQRG